MHRYLTCIASIDDNLGFLQFTWNTPSYGPTINCESQYQLQIVDIINNEAFSNPFLFSSCPTKSCTTATVTVTENGTAATVTATGKRTTTTVTATTCRISSLQTVTRVREVSTLTVTETSTKTVTQTRKG